LVAERPEIEGHVSNRAEGGATAAELAAQARVALKDVPDPQLVIIQTIDNDIRCDGTDDAHVAEFGASVEDVLTVLTRAAPDTKILMITQPGRPALELESMADVIQSTPAAKAVYSGPPPCGMFDENGNPLPENVAALTSIIESYEAEQQRVCAEYPQCGTDGGQLAAFRREPAMVSSDFNHLNPTGQAALASAVWPVVEQLLGLSTQ
jgi:lysophospholipase L1-like esterase